MALAKINLVPADQTIHEQVNLFSIHGPPRSGKTHQAVEITAGRVVGTIINDPNSLPVLRKRAQDLRNAGAEKTLLIPHDAKGKPITFHLDQSTAILKDPNICKAHYQKEVERLFELCDAILPHIDGLIVDNDSDLQKIFDYAFFGGVSRPKVQEYSPRNKALQRFYAMFKNAGVHTTLIHMSENRWHTSKKVNNSGREVTEFEVIGKRADIFSQMDYKFNAMFELVKLEPHIRADVMESINPAIKWYANHGVKMRQIGNDDILLLCLNSTAGVHINPRETVWLSKPKQADDLDYPDSITMDNVLGRLFPETDLEYWRRSKL